MALRKSISLTVIVLVLMLAVLGLSMGSRSSNCPADTWSALWLGGTGGMVKLLASDGTVLDAISGVGEVDSLAVDNLGMRVWVYRNYTLACLGFDGKVIFSATFPPAASAAAEDGERNLTLAVDPSDGGI
ncbi:MAG: hypothetical protein HQK56_11550 [Deltaproteobacteria bacterium]|nr:hypothetical protein [Deltaproteobacteria bacterium]